jgi:hypothetical protein
MSSHCGTDSSARPARVGSSPRRMRPRRRPASEGRHRRQPTGTRRPGGGPTTTALPSSALAFALCSIRSGGSGRSIAGNRWSVADCRGTGSRPPSIECGVISQVVYFTTGRGNAATTHDGRRISGLRDHIPRPSGRHHGIDPAETSRNDSRILQSPSISVVSSLMSILSRGPVTSCPVRSSAPFGWSRSRCRRISS